MGATNKGPSHSIRNRVCVRSYEFNVPILSPCYLARVQRVFDRVWQDVEVEVGTDLCDPTSLSCGVTDLERILLPIQRENPVQGRCFYKINKNQYTCVY